MIDQLIHHAEILSLEGNSDRLPLGSRPHSGAGATRPILLAAS